MDILSIQSVSLEMNQRYRNMSENKELKKTILFCTEQNSWICFQILRSLLRSSSFVREVPDAKYIIVNLATSINLNDEEMALIKKAEILFDTSGRSIRGDNTLSELLNRFGKEKFAFGSHSPILDYLSGQLRIESLSEAEADNETKELLRSGNAKKILAI